MQFEISSPGALKGTVHFPGDRSLTLSALAFGMLAGKTVTIRHPSVSPETVILKKFLRDSGLEYVDDPDTLIIRGEGLREKTAIPRDFPAEVFHVATAAAVFSGAPVVIDNTGGVRDSLLELLMPVLRSLGLREENITSAESSIRISGAAFSVSGRISAASAWEFEAITAAGMAARRPVEVAGNRQECSPALTLLEILGLRTSESGVVETDELARRLARISGEKPPDVFHIEGECSDSEIMIPGDVMLAAAVAGTAAVLPHSDVVLQGVLWDLGKRGFFEGLRRMKAQVEWTPRRGYSWDSADLRVRGSALEGIQITPAQARTMRSELMLLGAAAAFARGETIVRNPAPGPGISREKLRLFTDGLEMLGAHIGDYPEGMVVKGGFELKGNLTDSGGDPEVALALALAGMASSGRTVVFGCDAETYPVGDYLRLIAGLADSSFSFDSII
ncbi:MAG: 3-phosphoshikimate 1-carboxyvinyltransferase [Candidatus Latescibacterota bacterium]